MPKRIALLFASVIAVCLMACGPTPAQVSESGHELYGKGDFPAALVEYEKVQELLPDSEQAHYNAGNARYRVGEYERAIDDYDGSIRYAKDELRLRGFFNRGNAAFQMGQYTQAIEAYKEVLRIDPEDLDAKHNLELALNQLPPEAQNENEQQQEEQEEDEQEEQEQDNQQDDKRESDEPQEAEAQEDEEQQPPPQSDRMTEEQARQILESVGEAAQTLQERRQQVFVSPEEPSEFDW